MVDTKSLLIGAAILYLVLHYSSITAQETAPATQRADSRACYAAALAAVRDQWPALSQLQRAALGAQAIQICEAQP